MADRGITLTKYGQEHSVAGRTFGYRLRVTATEPLNISNRIFVYQKGMVDPETGETTSRFTNVASPADLEEYPADSPGDAVFYRLSELDLIFRAAETANECWDVILEDVRELLDTLDLMDELEIEESIRIGDAAP